MYSTTNTNPTMLCYIVDFKTISLMRLAHLCVCAHVIVMHVICLQLYHWQNIQRETLHYYTPMSITSANSYTCISAAEIHVITINSFGSVNAEKRTDDITNSKQQLDNNNTTSVSICKPLCCSTKSRSSWPPIRIFMALSHQIHISRNDN